MSLLSQSCAQATRLLSDSQESPLPVTARIGLRLHVAICRQCRRYGRQLRLIRAAFADFPEHLVPAEPLPKEWRRRIVRELTKSH